MLGNANQLEASPNSGSISQSEVHVTKWKNTVSGIEHLTHSSGRKSTVINSRPHLPPSFALPQLSSSLQQDTVLQPRAALPQRSG